MAPRYPLDAPFNSLGPCRPAPRLPGTLNRKGRLGALGVPPDRLTPRPSPITRDHWSLTLLHSLHLVFSQSIPNCPASTSSRGPFWASKVLFKIKKKRKIHVIAENDFRKSSKGHFHFSVKKFILQILNLYTGPFSDLFRKNCNI